MARDYYGTLGVRQDATSEEIKRAYRKLARELHPDVNPDEGAQERFREVTAAYEVLSDPQKRKIVDMGGDPLGNGGGGGGRDPFAGFGLGDIMDAFFGGGAGTGARAAQPGAARLRRAHPHRADAGGVQHRRQPRADRRHRGAVRRVPRVRVRGGQLAAGAATPAPGAARSSRVQRSFLGQVVTARPCPVCRGVGEVIPDPCRQCGGDGRVRARRTITAKVPPGVADGMRVRLSGQGEVGPGGGPAGDLYVEVVERPHPTFEREGADLHCTVRIPMTTAALGSVVPLDTLDDTVELVLEPGTQPNTELVLTGQGLPRLRSSGRVDGRGDLHVHVEVDIPGKLDARQTELLRELAALRGEEEHVVASTNGRGGGLFSRLRARHR